MATSISESSLEEKLKVMESTFGPAKGSRMKASGIRAESMVMECGVGPKETLIPGSGRTASHMDLECR